jgi:hypothetical protein
MDTPDLTAAISLTPEHARSVALVMETMRSALLGYLHAIESGTHSSGPAASIGQAAG